LRNTCATQQLCCARARLLFHYVSSHTFGGINDGHRKPSKAINPPWLAYLGTFCASTGTVLPTALVASHIHTGGQSAGHAKLLPDRVLDPSQVALSIGSTRRTAASLVSSHVRQLNCAHETPGWDDLPYPPCDELVAQAPVKQRHTSPPCSLEYMTAPLTPSASSGQAKVLLCFPFLKDDASNPEPTPIFCFMSSPSAEKCPAMTSTEDVVQGPPSFRKRTCTGSVSPPQECGRPSHPPLKKSARAPPEFMPAHRLMSEDVVEYILDALPELAVYVRELKRQISTLHESNETMESRILQLEKGYVHTNCANMAISIRLFMYGLISGCGKTRSSEGLIDRLSHDSLTLSSRQVMRGLFSK